MKIRDGESAIRKTFSYNIVFNVSGLTYPRKKKSVCGLIPMPLECG
uniref:Uncharacterized protein n=1 Tax=Rhizophora mucronata TaxID=61149 RepID=A0A2P2PX31_RHIMU